MLSATTANYESETFPFHRCGGKVNIYSVQIYFGIAVENEKNSIFTFPIPYLINEVKIRKKNVKPFSINMSNLKQISEI